MAIPTTNFTTGRRLDVMITTDYTGQLQFKFSNKLVTGIQKLVQRFIIKLFTQTNSKIFEPEDGNIFADNISLIAQSYGSLVYQRLQFSFARVIEQLRQDPSEFSDERLRNARIVEFLQDGDAALVKIEIVSEAGSDYTFVVPVVLEQVGQTNGSS